MKSLASLPVLTTLVLGRPLKLFISAIDESIGSLLAQDAEDGTEIVMYCLSQLLNNAETM